MKKTTFITLSILTVPFLLGFTYFIRLTDSYPPNRSIPNATQSGKQLAMQYCKMCHLAPEPHELDKITWQNSVLPNMGMRLGIKVKDVDPYEDLDPIDKSIVEKLNIYPNEPLIAKKDWDKIVGYYVSNAPENLPIIKTTEHSVKAPFSAQYIRIGDEKLPQVSLLKYNRGSGELYIGDNDNLYALKSNGEFSGVWKLNSPAVHMEFKENTSPLLLTIGKFSPSDQKLGRLAQLVPTESNLKNRNLASLQRPVYFASGDLNLDGKDDVIVSNFGNYTGTLAWYDDYDTSKEHVLSNLPGARKVILKDLNNDGKLDIIALMAQAYEKFVIYFNKGNAVFEEKNILEFSPVYGASNFELADFNNDGYDDLLITNGDNWDYSSIDKPYHGLRIYINDKRNNFEEKYFFPMYGCSNAVAVDFDNDGDLDIAATSFYSDLENPSESFVYLSNNGELEFTPSYLPEAKYGKWLTMEVGDFNNDNLPDIMLGSFLYNIKEMSKMIVTTGETSFPQVLLLLNKN
ncbi:VCBS repeat-containing protein [Cellulophaga sp. F20128]|uniref:FG-GAP repeat domain-containing protein n=1 Tax=Cellulophaga sp. F20128 TaxID=2926413 RepID=UPI001FF384F8|nr:VCBS repeat-containing protein [Cellulophaga sp. F20128]MCK0156709.1 VCBS repeat-containing protein [Cellulophaga sp. F20128]